MKDLFCLLFLLFARSYSSLNETLKAEIQKKIQAVKMRYIRRTFGSLSPTPTTTTNMEISSVVKRVPNFEDILIIVKKRKLRKNGRVTRGNSLSKTVLNFSAEEEATGKPTQWAN